MLESGSGSMGRPAGTTIESAVRGGTLHPEIVPGLPDADRELVAKYCWETNSNYDAVKLMLDLGFPVAHPEHSHGTRRYIMRRGRVRVTWWTY
jgi:hypothetical protein